MSYLSETVALIDGLHVRSFDYSRTDGDSGMSERVTVHMATCDDYARACRALNAKKSAHALTSRGTRYEALTADNRALVQHFCMPHLPCHGSER